MTPHHGTCHGTLSEILMLRDAIVGISGQAQVMSLAIRPKL